MYSACTHKDPGYLTARAALTLPATPAAGVGKAGKYPPFIGKVLSVKRLGGRDRERDVIKIVIDTGGVPYVEGQAFGVVPPVGVLWAGPPLSAAAF